MSYKQRKFTRDAQQKVLGDMSYSELKAYKYRLWLKLVKAYGSEAAVINAYKKRGIKITKPPPPTEIAGLGPSRLPGLPDIPTIVPVQRANIYPSEDEREDELDQIIEMSRDARLGMGLGFDFDESPVEVELPVDEEDELNDQEEKKEESKESKESIDYSRQIPPEFRSRQRTARNTNQTIQILNKIAAKMRYIVTRTPKDSLISRMKIAWSNNPVLQNKIIDIFEKNGIFIGHLERGYRVVDRAVDAIFNLPQSGLRIIMQDVARAFQNDWRFNGSFPIEGSPSQTDLPEEVQEPSGLQSQSVQEATVDALRQAGVDRGDANRIFEKLKNKLQKERTRIFGETGNYGESTDEANRQLVKWVEETIKYEIGERGLQVNLPNVFRILRSSFPILEAVPDRVISQMPTIRIPTISDATRNLPENEQKEVFDAVREAGLVSPNGEIVSYGNFIIRASQSVRNGIENLLSGAGRRQIEDWDYFDDPENEDPDEPRRPPRGGGGGGPPGGDPDPGIDPNQIEVWDRRVPDAPMLVYEGNIRQILAMISMFGGSIEKIEGFKSDVPPESDEIPVIDKPGFTNVKDASVRPIIDPSNVSPFDRIKDASVKPLGPGNMGHPAGEVWTPDINSKIQVAEEDLDNFTYRLNQARMFGASPQQIANLEDQVAKQREILLIAMQSKYGTTEIYPTDSPTPGDPGYRPVKPVKPDKPDKPDKQPDDADDADDADDEGVVVPDLDKLKSTDTSEGTRIAEYVNPAEVQLFLSTDKDAKAEQKRWEEFSRVQPGNSLGNARTNPLIRVNNEYYRKQFQNADKTRAKVKPYIVPTIQGIRRRAWSDPQFIDRLDGYEYGKVRFEADDYHTNRFMSNTLYNPMHTTDQWREYERPSTFHPELKLAGYRFMPTTIPELRTQAGFKGVDSRPSVNGNINIAPKQTGYEFSPMRRDDNFKGKPEKVKTQLTGFTQPVRMTSTRGGR